MRLKVKVKRCKGIGINKYENNSKNVKSKRSLCRHGMIKRWERNYIKIIKLLRTTEHVTVEHVHGSARSANIAKMMMIIDHPLGSSSPDPLTKEAVLG